MIFFQLLQKISATILEVGEPIGDPTCCSQYLPSVSKLFCFVVSLIRVISYSCHAEKKYKFHLLVCALQFQ
jgi:hypothetical protein